MGSSIVCDTAAESSLLCVVEEISAGPKAGIVTLPQDGNRGISCGYCWRQKTYLIIGQAEARNKVHRGQLTCPQNLLQMMDCLILAR